MQRRLICFVFIVLPWTLSAQTGDMKPIEIKGHFIGESIVELLSKEPKVQQQINLCEQDPIRPTCCTECSLKRPWNWNPPANDSTSDAFVPATAG